jgi:hypothetical protein
MAGILALGVAPARVLDTISTSIAKANFTPRTPPATLTAGSATQGTSVPTTKPDSTSVAQVSKPAVSPTPKSAN